MPAPLSAQLIDRPRRSAGALACAISLVGALAACDIAEKLDLRPPAPSAHERYADRLSDAGLAETALGRDWLAASRSALRSPVAVTLPFREAGYFAQHEARSVAYEAVLRDGQKLVATVETQGAPFNLFVDVFEQTGDTLRPFERVASADSGSSSLEFEADREGTYLIRLQPELLRSGRFVLTLSVEPTLAFPVSGRGRSAVKSFFGADRDAGRRRHHGIDIFAPRGTPVLAAADGFVRSTSPNDLGGNVVWLRDAKRSQTLYYAHLDRHAVQAGQHVHIGDTLGFVGNTGNAATTAPHLHFGVYRRGRGPVDPLPFVYHPAGEPPRLTAATSLLGSLARTAVRETPVVSAPRASAALVATVARSTPITVDGAAGDWYRVRLPDGSSGYVRARQTEGADAAVRRERLAAGTIVRDRPASDAAVVATMDGATSLPVLGVYANFALVETGTGRTGWVAID